MTTGTVEAIDRSVHKTNEWLADLDGELGLEDRQEAWRILRAFLQLLRDRITIDEAAHLAAQLPHVLRGVFYEGFDPRHTPETEVDRDAFLARLADGAGLAGPTEASLAAEAAMRVLLRHVTSGAVDDVLAQLPGDDSGAPGAALTPPGPDDRVGDVRRAQVRRSVSARGTMLA